MGGGKNPSSGAQVNPASAAQGRIAQQIFKESTPLRLALINTIGKSFGLPGITEADLPKGYKGPIPGAIEGLFSATPTERSQIESQYGTARSNLMGTTAGRGSFLDRNLANIETARAMNMADLIGGEKQRALNLGANVAFGTPKDILSSGYASSFLQNKPMQQQDKSGLGGIGSGLGMIIGAGKCWIAAAIYGDGSDEFYLARFAIFELWKGRLARAVQKAYLRWGERIAEFLKLHPVCKSVFKPFFDFAIRKARENLYARLG